jgi:hypothetical protein
MTLHNMIKADAASVFCNANDFAEPVTYYTRSGSAREIQAVVIREALAILSEDGDNVVPMFEIHVTNNATTGIASDELNLGGDSMEFAIRVDGPKTRRTILKLLSHDEGMLVLECR